MRFFCIVLLFLISSPVWGVTKTALGGNWATGANWSPAGVPGGGDNVIIPVGVTQTINANWIIFFNLSINTITVNGTLDLNNAGLSLNSFDVLTVNTGGQITSSGLAFITSGLNPPITTFPINGPATITGGSLPITLLFFKGSPIENGVVLTWASATELNFDHYRIEYSTDGEKFELLTKIKGAINSDLRRDYEYIDYAPRFGTNYYRLVSVDLDGYTEYFDVIFVHYNKEGKIINVYPNPATVGESVSIQGNFNSKNKIIVRDLQGRVVIDSGLSDNSETQLSTSQLSPGMYVISLLTSEGLFTEKLVIK